MCFRKTGFTIFLLAFVTLFSCAPKDSAPQPQLAVQYVKASIEWAAACEQTYRMAWPHVERAAQNESGNWVVALDVDETVLDNTGYAVELEQAGQRHTRELWQAWCRREEAPPIFGVKTFLEKVRTLGSKGRVAFITNRRIAVEEATVANLKKKGLWRDGDIILTKMDENDTKVDRRNALETGTGRSEANGPLTIIALFGDNIRDFMAMQGGETAADYRQNKLAQDAHWGTRFFMLSNPTYGSWTSNYK